MPGGGVVLMRRPSLVPPAFGRPRQYAAAHRDGANVPFRCTLMTASHSSSVMLVSMRSRRMPALLIRTSRPPKLSMAVFTKRSAPSHVEMSSPLATASPPIALISFTTSSAGPVVGVPDPSISPPRSLTTTLAPCSASISACSRPMPRPAPVTMHTRPSHIPATDASPGFDWRHVYGSGCTGRQPGERLSTSPSPGAATMADEMRFENRMSDADALMWTIEKDPLLRSTITSVAVLDQSPDPDRLVESLDRATRLVPRLRQRVVSNAMSIAPPRWEFDPNFDIAYHLRWMKAPGEGTLRDLLDMAQPIAMQGFDRARPLWEFVVVDGLADGRAGLIIKVHHAITDGVGAVKIAMHLFDVERDTPLDRGPMPDEPEIHVMNQLERMRAAFDHERRRQAGIARRSAAS